MGHSRPLFFFYFRPFLDTVTNKNKIWLYKSLVGVLIATRILDRRIVGANKTTELWRPPINPKTLKNGPIPASFCLFSSFSHNNFN